MSSEVVKERKQYVCTVCGYNMVGYYPNNCPFCGAPKEKFIMSEECSDRFKVEATPVSEKVASLNSVPPLGLEHSAYRAETNGNVIWIDCPSSFDKSLESVDVIMFTHHHFLGACNLYREYFGAEVWIHKLDSSHNICRGFLFDEVFQRDFRKFGMEAFHIDGHTPGFTFYIFEDIMFVCDYVFLRDGRMQFNPFGPEKETREGAYKIKKIIAGRELSKVCGNRYMVDYLEWKEKFDGLLGKET